MIILIFPTNFKIAYDYSHFRTNAGNGGGRHHFSRIEIIIFGKGVNILIYVVPMDTPSHLFKAPIR